MTLSPNLINQAMRKRRRYTVEKEAQLGRWRANIATMETRIDEGNLTYRDKLIHLKREMRIAEEQLGELQVATGEAWDGLRSRVDSLWEELSESLNKTKQEFQDNLN